MDGVRVAPSASLDDIAAALPACVMERGSGGRALTCGRPDRGAVTTFFDSYGRDEVDVILTVPVDLSLPPAG